MSLPVVKTPTYTMKLISTKEEIEYRPFLVGEEKVLWMALESENQQEIIQTLRNVVKACTFDKIDINSLPDFDLIYIFIKLRSKSVGEVVEVDLKSKDGVEGHTIPVAINLEDVQIIENPDHKSNFKLTDELGVEMKYPLFEDIERIITNTTNKYDQATEIIKTCLVSVYDNDQVYMIKDATDKEIESFINSLNKSHLEQILNFFETMPKVKLVVDYEDTFTGTQEQLVLEGMDSFFI